MKGRVLVVDDDPALAEMLGIVLRGEGFDPAFVADGGRALNSFRDIKPDVVHVLVDGRIVRTGGAEVADELERDGYAPYGVEEEAIVSG